MCFRVFCSNLAKSAAVCATEKKKRKKKWCVVAGSCVGSVPAEAGSRDESSGGRAGAVSRVTARAVGPAVGRLRLLLEVLERPANGALVYCVQPPTSYFYRSDPLESGLISFPTIPLSLSHTHTLSLSLFLFSSFFSPSFIDYLFCLFFSTTMLWTTAWRLLFAASLVSPFARSSLQFMAYIPAADHAPLFVKGTDRLCALFFSSLFFALFFFFLFSYSTSFCLSCVCVCVCFCLSARSLFCELSTCAVACLVT